MYSHAFWYFSGTILVLLKEEFAARGFGVEEAFRGPQHEPGLRVLGWMYACV